MSPFEENEKRLAAKNKEQYYTQLDGTPVKSIKGRTTKGRTIIKFLLNLVAAVLIVAAFYFIGNAIFVFEVARSSIHEIFGVAWIICALLAVGFAALIISVIHLPMPEKGEKQ